MAIGCLSTVKQFAAKYPAWTEAALRDLIFKSKPRHSSRGIIPGNGLASAIIRIGQKILIDDERWFELLRSLSQENEGGIDAGKTVAHHSTCTRTHRMPRGERLTKEYKPTSRQRLNKRVVR
jgi:hypothetical protein